MTFLWTQFEPENAPLLIWLNGGPGASTMFGLFVENGPFSVDRNGKLEYRSTSWALSHSVLYFDNPVGTGIRAFFFVIYLCHVMSLSFKCGMLTVFQKLTSWYTLLGFSFTKSEDGYARTQEDVTDGLYSALLQFYQLFPDFKGRDLYITGESYAGTEAQ
jgi:vitellogenic carboxypeptidase-like protein